MILGPIPSIRVRSSGLDEAPVLDAFLALADEEPDEELCAVLCLAAEDFFADDLADDDLVLAAFDFALALRPPSSRSCSFSNCFQSPSAANLACCGHVSGVCICKSTLARISASFFGFEPAILANVSTPALRITCWILGPIPSIRVRLSRFLVVDLVTVEVLDLTTVDFVGLRFALVVFDFFLVAALDFLAIEATADERTVVDLGLAFFFAFLLTAFVFAFALTLVVDFVLALVFALAASFFSLLIMPFFSLIRLANSALSALS